MDQKLDMLIRIERAAMRLTKTFFMRSTVTGQPYARMVAADAWIAASQRRAELR